MPKTPPPPRTPDTPRTAGTNRPSAARSSARGAAVVEAVFHAAFEEILRVGYGGLSIEDVAARAGVNKTTVYRRWPTKLDLVSAALVSLPPQFGSLPNAGSFRGDVIASTLAMVRFFHTLAGRAIMRLALFEIGVPMRPEFARVRAAFDAHDEMHGLEAIVNRAIARGELPRSFDRRVLIDALFCTVAVRCLSPEGPEGPLDQDFVVRLVDGLLTGLIAQSLIPQSLTPRNLPNAPAPKKPAKKPARARGASSRSGSPGRRTTST